MAGADHRVGARQGERLVEWNPVHRHAAHPDVGLLAQRTVGDQDAAVLQATQVREVLDLEAIQLLVAPRRGRGRADEEDDRVLVESLGNEALDLRAPSRR